jgi:hypothetical protein
VYVRHDNSVLTFIVRFDFANAKGDRVRISFREEFESTSFDNFGHALVKFECRWRVSFDLYKEVRDLIWKFFF